MGKEKRGGNGKEQKGESEHTQPRGPGKCRLCSVAPEVSKRKGSKARPRIEH